MKASVKLFKLFTDPPRLRIERGEIVDASKKKESGQEKISEEKEALTH
jgi:hypothetical protein